MAPASLKLIDFSDREFLYAVDDALNAEGWATVHDIQAVLQLDHPYATNCIGSRCGYLRSVGAVDRFDGGPPSQWYITNEGAALMKGTYNLRNVSPGQVLAAMRALNESVDSMDHMHHIILRREFRYGDAQRRRHYA